MSTRARGAGNAGAERHVLARVLRALVLGGVLYGLPLLGATERYGSWRLWLLAGSFFAMDLVQPSLGRAIQAKGGEDADRRSVQVLLTMALVAQVLPLVEWGYRSPRPLSWWSACLGSALVLAGGLLRAWAIRTLGRFFTATVMLQREHRLVVDGPYRWLQHPSYTGALLLVLAGPVLLETPFSLAVVALSLGIAYVYRIRVEERALRHHFGKAFEEYSQTRARLLPFLW